MDVQSKLNGCRWSLEVTEVHTYYYECMTDVLTYYQCVDDLLLIREQLEKGVSHRVPYAEEEKEKNGKKKKKETTPEKKERSSYPTRRGVSVVADSELLLPPSPRRSTVLPPPHHYNNTFSLSDALRNEMHPQPSSEVISRRHMSTHRDTILSIYSSDPHFISLLREILLPPPGTHPYCASLASQKRLLKLFESGLPPWAVWVANSIGCYRRLHRVLYTILTNVWPILSLAVGVYDLYKHLPQLTHFVSHLVEPFSVFLQKHFKLKLSVWGAYLLSVVVSLSNTVYYYYYSSPLSFLVWLVTPMVRLFYYVLLRLPFLLLFDLVGSLYRVVSSLLLVVFMTGKVVLLGPLLLVQYVLQVKPPNLTGGSRLFRFLWYPFQGSGAASPPSNISFLVSSWWGSVVTFWITVASPIKNMLKAWWDSILHVLYHVFVKREYTLRVFYESMKEKYVTRVEEVREDLTRRTSCFCTDATIFSVFYGVVVFWCGTVIVRECAVLAAVSIVVVSPDKTDCHGK
ncbi:hypothetical protein AGDE_16394 [Angomonas deanei]|uniref:Uncharacterized protein n=1 Tax=Angomonas deanei TaxID=59799 RepID=A0A7G2CQ57_9TRYP|nr:hypothetical protein AGDE_16394 [Angomonas deanei]CAD2221910.1 hypothetical protein, conserved [Angomonas deanei]|eukprot:EPY17158.1 hypothetical protein AGDE_16394 [Angomonas deanei]